MKKPRKSFDLCLGTWRLRNGCIVEIRESELLTYDNPRRHFVMWTGWCATCRIAISWLDFSGGRYSTRGQHQYDIVECIQLKKARKAAA